MVLQISKLEQDPVYIITHAGRIRQDEVIQSIATLNRIIPEETCSLIMDFTDAMLPFLPGEHRRGYVDALADPNLFRLVYLVPAAPDHTLTQRLDDIAERAGITHKVRYAHTRDEAEQIIRSDLLGNAS